MIINLVDSILVGVLGLLQIADTYTTRLVIEKAGGRELNPIIKTLINKVGYFGILVIKLLGAALISWVAVTKLPDYSTVILILANLVFAAVSYNNYLIYKRDKPRGS